MKAKVLKVHPNDNVIVALQNLQRGETVQLNGSSYVVEEDIPAKHKFTAKPLHAGDDVTMYGVLVGKAKTEIAQGLRISTENITHASGNYNISNTRRTEWQMPNLGSFKDRTF